jgi:signal recognition particle receptor subunit beta
MTSRLSETSRLSDATVAPADGHVAARPLKIVVAGGFAAGKTTFVDSISEITPLTTEAPMTSAALGIDDTGLVPTKVTTTVAMDFGRITLGGAMMLYLFGTPGQDRFWFMWDELSRGAVGAVVLVDTRRLADCFPAVDYFEQRGLPYVVALNRFNGDLAHTPDAVRKALAVDASVPVLVTDARDRAFAKETLVELVRHAIARKRQTA